MKILMELEAVTAPKDVWPIRRAALVSRDRVENNSVSLGAALGDPMAQAEQSRIMARTRIAGSDPKV